MFADSEAFVRDLPVSHRCSATDLDPNADIDLGADDALIDARASDELGQLREPWFAVVHYSSTHFPYLRERGRRAFSTGEPQQIAER